MGKDLWHGQKRLPVFTIRFFDPCGNFGQWVAQSRSCQKPQKIRSAGLRNIRFPWRQYFVKVFSRVFFHGDLRSVGNHSLNVVGVNRWVALQDFILANTSRKIVQNYRRHDSGPLHARFTMANLWIDCDSLSPIHVDLIQIAHKIPIVFQTLHQYCFRFQKWVSCLRNDMEHTPNRRSVISFLSL